MSFKQLPCTQCGALLYYYYLKDGICNACRNPHLVVTAQIGTESSGTHMHDRLNNLDTITICPYCGDETKGRMGCCGESSAHFERHYYDFKQDLFINPKTGEATDDFSMETMVYERA